LLRIGRDVLVGYVDVGDTGVEVGFGEEDEGAFPSEFAKLDLFGHCLALKLWEEGQNDDDDNYDLH
jgi:hypothetical protein